MTTPFAVRHEADDDIVKLLEDALEGAKRGEIVSIAIAIVFTGHQTGEAWTMPRGGYRPHLLGAIAMLQHKIAEGWKVDEGVV